MLDKILEKSGLTKPGVMIYGENTANYLTRKECNISHIIVEGGPLTDLTFLEERMIDREIII